MRLGTFANIITIDKKLHKACAKGNRKAQYQLYKMYFDVLMGVAMRYKSNPEDARVLVNQGFLKIFDNLEKYTFQGSFDAWIRRIMINTLIDDFRQIQIERERIEHTDFSDLNGVVYGFDFNEAEQLLNVEQLEAMIHLLPPMTKNVFNLYAIDGYKHREIAALFSISIGTSKWHLSEARKKLITMIQNNMTPTLSSLQKGKS